jgi:uncharacterized protein (DUF1330 family)
MTAYIYANIKIHNSALYEQYRAGVRAVIAAFGGRYLVRGGAVEVLEGAPELERQVILEFPDMAALKAFYSSPEYSALLAIRQQAATGSLIAIEGMA